MVRLRKGTYKAASIVVAIIMLLTIAYFNDLWPSTSIFPWIRGSNQDTADSNFTTKWPIVHLKNCNHKEFMNRGRNAPNLTTPFPYPRTGLVSAQGSGNTWTRHLIEATTGLWTGSAYSSPATYKGGMIGEMEDCFSNSTVVMKAHHPKLEQRNNCYFHRIVLIIRETGRAVLAEYNRLRGRGKTGFANRTLFKTDDWRRFARVNSRTFRGFILGWIETFREKDKPLKSGENPFSLPYDYWKSILFVSYERMKKDPLKETKRIVDFLGLPTFRKHCIQENPDGNFRRTKASAFPAHCAYKEDELKNAIQSVNRDLHNGANKFGVGDITVEFGATTDTDVTKC